MKFQDIRSSFSADLKYAGFEFGEFQSEPYAGTIEINGTFFSNGILTIPPKIKRIFSNYSVENHSATGTKLGIRGVISFDGEDYETSLNLREKNRYDGYRQTSKNPLRESDELELSQFERVKNGIWCADMDYFGKLGDLEMRLRNEFLATKFVFRMKNKGDRVNVGEKLTGFFQYLVKDNIPVLKFTVAKLVKIPDEKRIKINGQEISAELCRSIEEKFSAQGISPGAAQSSGIYWHQPTNWTELPPKLENKRIELFKHDHRYAVYMWIGHREGETNTKYLYIGMVGTEKNKHNSVGNRIWQEQNTGIAQENNVSIDKFRYCALNTNGTMAVEDLIKTVEMQLINGVSALFPYGGVDGNGKKNLEDPIIKPLFDSIRETAAEKPGDPCDIILLNRDKRYHHL